MRIGIARLTLLLLRELLMRETANRYQCGGVSLQFRSHLIDIPFLALVLVLVLVLVLEARRLHNGWAMVHELVLEARQLHVGLAWCMNRYYILQVSGNDPMRVSSPGYKYKTSLEPLAGYTSRSASIA